MISIENFEQVAAQIESERGITKADLVSAIEQALISACRRRFPEEAIIDAKMDHVTGAVEIYRKWEIVEEIEIEDAEILLADAKKQEKGAEIGGFIVEIVTPSDFGRIAAQTAKQVIIQRIREAEKNVIFDEFSKKIDTIITGEVQRIENQNYLINLGRTEAILSYREQIPGEKFQVKEKIKLYVVDIEKNNRGAFIHISRTHPGFLKKLFEIEIPEIQDGIIEIMSVAREPGKRAKVAVKSNNPTIGAVGTCVGPMGGRIQSIIKELGFEKIDVLEWDEDPNRFISNALKPAKISQVTITDDEEKTAVVVVPNDQLSLAIGKSGINVRLSVKLTGWKLDIVSEEEYDSKRDEILGQPTLSIAEKIRLDKERMEEEEAAENQVLLQHEASKVTDDGHDDTASDEETVAEVETDAAEQTDVPEEEAQDAAAEDSVEDAESDEEKTKNTDEVTSAG
jgi:N utilization substance protein A